MWHKLLIGVVLGLVLLASRFVAAAGKAETKTRSSAISFRCVKTPAGPMVEMATDDVQFVVPYLKVPAGGWPSQGEMHPIGDLVEWRSAKGATTTARRITVNPVTGHRHSNASAISLQGVKTPSGPMIEIKTRGAVALVPYIKVPPGHNLGEGLQALFLHVEAPPSEGEIRPIGDRLEWNTKNTRVEVSSLSFLVETKKSPYELNGGN